MEMINATRMVAGYSVAVDRHGREQLVVVIKGTFVLPANGQAIRLHDEQLPLVMADTFSGEPGRTAPVQEIDFAPHKPACDVLLVGHARAPQGREVTRLRAGLRVGPMEKSFDVVGDRIWQAGLTGISASAPQPFTEKLVSYDTAFGGTDAGGAQEAMPETYLPNPVGRGWHHHLRSAWVDGKPLPNTEEVGQPVRSPDHPYTPVALGPVGRGWPQRARHAGTYDQAWMDKVFPFLPQDFDERYYQAAPQDQQVPVPAQPMEVVLSGFTADGVRQFVLPHFEAPVSIVPKRSAREDAHARLDTIVFEPDSERFTMSWRLARPLKKSIHEIAQVLVGRKGREWWQQREQLAFPIPVVMVPMEKPE
ncbi:DUF2169 family type VI secretion system accessory protein [Piscinibacter terrae]|uniref:DUF2169 domain-containing protein n=1 Tax=Piscinibacter terrae TaxID=2496871 RepID=A0A3N7HSX0_9BURK|nr:DUF2169 domain-containing protein [Albitalea terrae]RQP25397.1 DUF2169 domain-containing protein [Albitalea terrae]